MSDDEFNLLIDDLILGLPITLVVTRLLLALRTVLRETGEAGEQALRDYCAQGYKRDERLFVEGDDL